MISALVEANALYSLFALDLVRIDYFLDDQDIRLSHRYMQYAPIDFRSSTSQAQSASVYPVIFISPLAENLRPKSSVSFRYLRTLLQAKPC